MRPMTIDPTFERAFKKLYGKPCWGVKNWYGSGIHLCDLCVEPRSSAEIRCDKHRLDLGTSHLRAHFYRRKCRLVPMDREPTVSEELSEKINATLSKLRKSGRRTASK